MLRRRGRSLIYIAKYRRPSIEPRGTPISSCVDLERQLIKNMTCLSDKHDVINLSI